VRWCAIHRAGHLVELGCEIAVAGCGIKQLSVAINGACAVRSLPVRAQSDDAPAEMRQSIEAIGDTVEAAGRRRH
jgi:hypothetical protein